MPMGNTCRGTHLCQINRPDCHRAACRRSARRAPPVRGRATALWSPTRLPVRLPAPPRAARWRGPIPATGNRRQGTCVTLTPHSGRPASRRRRPFHSWCRLRSGESMSRRQRACQRSIGPVTWSAFAPAAASRTASACACKSWRRRARPRPVACATNCARRTGTPTCGCCTASGAMKLPCRRTCPATPSGSSPRCSGKRWRRPWTCRSGRGRMTRRGVRLSPLFWRLSDPARPATGPLVRLRRRDVARRRSPASHRH